MSNDTTIHVADKDRVRTITLQRPERRNALTAIMIAELTSAIKAFSQDDTALVLLLTGAGESFCSGLDLDELQKMSTQGEKAQQESSDSIAIMLRNLYDCPKPTIAAVNGAAVAGGMGLATICDFTYALSEAKFGYPEVKIGFIPAIVSAFLRNQVGEKQVLDLLLTGRLIDAQEAVNLGLATKVVASGQLLSETGELARQLMKISPASLMATKRLLRQQGSAQLTRDIEAAAAANAAMRQTEDFKEGLSAFLEKRKPLWTGR